MIVNRNILKYMPRNERYNRAVKYYTNKKVTICNTSHEDENNYSVVSKVEGSYGLIYNVYLGVTNGRIESFDCNCLDCSKNNMCKHVIATLFETLDPHIKKTQAEIIEEIKMQEYKNKILEQQRLEAMKKREYEIKYRDSLNLINNFSKSSQKLSKYENLNLEEIEKEALQSNSKVPCDDVQDGSVKLICKITITYDNKMEVNFKIGNTRMYVLKDIASFTNAYERNEIFEFGDKLKFRIEKNKFCESSKELFQFIIDYGKIFQYSKNQKYGNYYSMDIKNITIPLSEKDHFFDILESKTVNVCFEYDQNIDYLVTNEEIQPKFSIKKNLENEYILTQDTECDFYTVSTKNIYIGSCEKIYKINKEENIHYLGLLNITGNGNQMLIPADKIEDFKQTVVPNIKKYVLIENGQDDIENIESYDLGVKVFFDLNESGDITADLKYCYNEYEFNPLSKSTIDSTINDKRDYAIEHENLLMFFKDGFKVSNKNDKFIMHDEEKIYEFLSEKIEIYMKKFEVLATDNFFKKQIRKPKLGTIGVRIDSELLKIDLSKLDFNADEIKQVMQSYNIKKKYHRLKDGTFLNLEKNEELDFVNNITTNMDIDFKQMKNGVLKTNVSRSMYLQKLLEKNSKMNIEKDENFNSLINNIENKNYSDNITIPKKIDKNLRDYQKTGYKWLKVLEEYRFGGILADDMGLGKTLQIISIISAYIDENKKTKNPSIVICPSSLVINWLAEVEKWSNNIKVLIISGNAIERKNLIETIKDFDLVITSYDLLKRDIDEYLEKEYIFQYIIADEAQYIKNFNTQNAAALKSLKGNCKFALTGTPIENSVSELWSIFDYIMPGYLYNYHKFKKNYEEPIIKNNSVEALNRLKLLIAPFILRRLKKDVLMELPDKNITIINNEMAAEQQKIYMAYLSQIKAEVSDELKSNGFEKSKFKILMLLTRLRQICCHPSLFLTDYKGESGKLEQCLDILNESISSGHKVLLFSQYTSMFEIIEEKLKKLDIKYYKLTGDTNVSKRVDMVNEFNESHDIKVFLISLKAGGTGLNLTGADVVIHYDPWWNLSAENQATDRAYRIGQKNSVQVYKMITKNTIEEKISELQQKKSKISEELLSTEDTFINKLSKDEIMNLFE